MKNLKIKNTIDLLWKEGKNRLLSPLQKEKKRALELYFFGFATFFLLAFVLYGSLWFFRFEERQNTELAFEQIERMIGKMGGQKIEKRGELFFQGTYPEAVMGSSLTFHFDKERALFISQGQFFISDESLGDLVKAFEWQREGVSSSVEQLHFERRGAKLYALSLAVRQKELS